MSFVVAIDGPAGTGKGTVTKIISEKYGLMNVDTGALFRAVTLEVINKNINIQNDDEVTKMLDEIQIKLEEIDGQQKVYLNGEDVTKEIWEPKITKQISQVSNIKKVRYKMEDIQRNLAKNNEVIIEGRDIGTTVFPNADVKIYLDADVEERAKRRLLQNQEKNIQMSYEEILESIKRRDENDMNREMGALKKADDAVLIDTTHLTIEQVVKKIEDLIEKKGRNKKICTN